MAKKIKYVELSLMSTKKTGTSNLGLFTGIKISEGETFLRLQENSYTNLYFNIKSYDIKILKVTHVGSKTQSFFGVSTIEQEKALTAIKKISLELRESDLLDKEGAVDYLKKYLDVPSIYKDSKGNVFGLNTKLPIVEKTPNTKKEVHALAVVKNNNTINKNFEKTIKYIRRKTKKPSKEFLTSMRKKVNQITEGVYKQKQLPLIKVETTDKDDNSLESRFDKRQNILMDQYNEGWHKDHGYYDGYE